MSALNRTTPNTDYDAAQALLDLQGTLKEENPIPYVWSTDSREDMEKTARLFWNCFASSEIPAVSFPNNNRLESGTKSTTTAESTRKPNSIENYSSHLKTEHHHNKFSLRYPHRSKIRSKIAETHNIIQLARLEASNELKVKNNERVNTIDPKTREIGTQTEERYFNPNIELMEMTIKNLCERIQSLEAQLKDLSVEKSGYVSSENDKNMDGKSHENQNNDYNMSLSADCINESNNSQCIKYSHNIEFERSQDHRTTSGQKKINALHSGVIMNHNIYTNSSDVIPIGDGHASVPARLLKHINWSSYTGATRKLLTAVFSRRILATHSLTGKPSPAFPNKPAKKKLDPALVNDIVQTVVERCSVPENVVRTSITTKCADESKMFRTRQNNKKRRSNKNNRENIPPTTSESDSDNYY